MVWMVRIAGNNRYELKIRFKWAVTVYLHDQNDWFGWGYDSHYNSNEVCNSNLIRALNHVHKPNFLSKQIC